MLQNIVQSIKQFTQLREKTKLEYYDLFQCIVWLEKREKRLKEKEYLKKEAATLTNLQTRKSILYLIQKPYNHQCDKQKRVLLNDVLNLILDAQFEQRNKQKQWKFRKFFLRSPPILQKLLNRLFTNVIMPHYQRHKLPEKKFYILGKICRQPPKKIKNIKRWQKEGDIFKDAIIEPSSQDKDNSVLITIIATAIEKNEYAIAMHLINHTHLKDNQYQNILESTLNKYSTLDNKPQIKEKMNPVITTLLQKKPTLKDAMIDSQSLKILLDFKLQSLGINNFECTTSNLMDYYKNRSLNNKIYFRNCSLYTGLDRLLKTKSWRHYFRQYSKNEKMGAIKEFFNLVIESENRDQLINSSHYLFYQHQSIFNSGRLGKTKLYAKWSALLATPYSPSQKINAKKKSLSIPNTFPFSLENLQ